MDIGEVMERLRSYRPKELFQVGTDRFFHELLTLVAGLCGTHMNSLYLTDPSGERLLLKAAIGLPPTWLESAREIPIGLTAASGVCGRAAALGQVVVAETLDDPATAVFRDEARAAGVRSLWSVPLVDSDGHVIGTFATYHTTPKAPAVGEIRLVQEVARQAAFILETARLYHARESAWELHRRAQLLAQQLVGRTDPQQVFAAIADGLKQLLRVDLVWLSQVAKDGTVQFFQSDDLFVAPPPQVAGSPCRQALETKRTAVHMYFEFPAAAPLVRPLRLGTLVCHPQELESGYVLTSAGWYHRHRFTEEDGHILDLFTKFGAIALQNATRLDLLRSSYFGMVRGLLTALEVRDYETVAHSRRVMTYTMLLLERIGHDHRKRPAGGGPLQREAVLPLRSGRLSKHRAGRLGSRAPRRAGSFPLCRFRRGMGGAAAHGGPCIDPRSLPKGSLAPRPARQTWPLGAGGTRRSQRKPGTQASRAVRPCAGPKLPGAAGRCPG